MVPLYPSTKTSCSPATLLDLLEALRLEPHNIPVKQELEKLRLSGLKASPKPTKVLPTASVSLVVVDP